MSYVDSLTSSTLVGILCRTKVLDGSGTKEGCSLHEGPIAKIQVDP